MQDILQAVKIRFRPILRQPVQKASIRSKPLFYCKSDHFERHFKIGAKNCLCGYVLLTKNYRF